MAKKRLILFDLTPTIYKKIWVVLAAIFAVLRAFLRGVGEKRVFLVWSFVVILWWIAGENEAG